MGDKAHLRVWAIVFLAVTVILGIALVLQVNQ
jgi:hypothetical protein